MLTCVGRLICLTASLLAVALASGHPSLAVNIYVVPAEGGKQRIVHRDDDRKFGSPDWSPDGKTIACDTWRIGGTLQDSEIALVPAEGGEMVFFGAGAMPSWSPDGTQIVCHTYNPNQIVVLDADGGGREAILDQWGSPRWSPDGGSIITVRSQGGLARFDLATGKQTIETAKQFSLWQGFSISPDGKRYCFAVRNGRGLGTASYDDNTNDWILKRHAQNLSCMHSSWSPDSKRVVFHGTPTGSEEPRLFILDVDQAGKQQVEPLRVETAERYCSSPDWSPDGETIVFIGVDPE